MKIIKHAFSVLTRSYLHIFLVDIAHENAVPNPSIYLKLFFESSEAWDGVVLIAPALHTTYYAKRVSKCKISHSKQLYVIYAADDEDQCMTHPLID